MRPRRAAAGQERDDLGDIFGLIADALHIRDHFQGCGDLPQVARDRLLLEQQLEAEGFDIPLLLVDLRVQRRDLLREAHVSVRHRLGGQCDDLFTARAHFDQFSVQQRKLLVNNLSVTKTAAALYLHRSTLLDRLAHITQMLGCDLKNPDFCLTLGILLRAELQQKRFTQAKP